MQNDFLNLFTENNSDTLQIQSTTPEYLSEMPDYKFLGKQIDKKFFNLFSNEQILDTAKYYACTKQKFSDSILILTMRTPAAYWESSVKIYLFDVHLNKVVSMIEAADVDGDEVNSKTKYSNLINKKNTVSLEMFTSECTIDEESGGSECIDSTFYYNFKNNQINLLKKEKRI